MLFVQVKVLTLQNGDKVERWDPNVYMMDYLYGQATSQKAFD